MKKILIMPLAFLALASCVNPQTPSDFTSLYNANIKAEMAKMEETMKVVYGPQKEVTGQISSSVITDNPQSSMTGTFSSNYTLYAGGGMASLITLESPQVKIDGTEHMGGDQKNNTVTDVKAQKVDLLGMMASFARFDKITANVTSSVPEVQQNAQKEIADVMTKLESFNGKWIALDENVDAQTLKMMAALSQMTRKDVENYLTKYPILSASGAATVEGTKHTFNAMLDKVQLINLIDAINSDLGAQKMTEEDKQHLIDTMKSVAVAGTVAYDTKDPLYSDYRMIMTVENQPQKLKIHSTRNGEKWNLSLAVLNATQPDEAESFALNIESTSKEKSSAFTGTVMVNMDGKNPMELASFHGKTEDLVLKNFNLDGSFMGIMGVSVAYTHKDKLIAKVMSGTQESILLENTYMGENIHGKVLAEGKEMVHWDIFMKNDKVTALTAWIDDFMATPLENASPEKIFTIDLKEREGSEMIHGQAILATEHQKTSADVALNVSKNKFGLILENILINDQANVFPMKKFDFFMTAQERETSKKFEIPTEIVPLGEFIEAIDGGIKMNSLHPDDIMIEEAKKEMPQNPDAVQPVEKITQ